MKALVSAHGHVIALCDDRILSNGASKEVALRGTRSINDGMEQRPF